MTLQEPIKYNTYLMPFLITSFADYIMSTLAYLAVVSYLKQFYGEIVSNLITLFTVLFVGNIFVGSSCCWCGAMLAYLLWYLPTIGCKMHRYLMILFVALITLMIGFFRYEIEFSTLILAILFTNSFAGII